MASQVEQGFECMIRVYSPVSDCGHTLAWHQPRDVYLEDLVLELVTHQGSSIMAYEAEVWSWRAADT